MRYSPWRLFLRVVEWIRAWRTERRTTRAPGIPRELYVGIDLTATFIHRDVTPTGVRVYSLCASCGARLHASATLCEECAQKRSRPARPY